MKYTVYVTGVDTDEKAAAVAGIRACRAVLGDRLGSTAKRGEETFEACKDSERFKLGAHADPRVALEAAERGMVASNSALLLEVDPDPEIAAGDAGTSEDNDAERIPIYKIDVGKDTVKDAVLVEDLEDLCPYDWPVVAHALVNLVAAKGVITHAYAYAQAHAVHDDTWDEVVDIYEKVFPGAKA